MASAGYGLAQSPTRLAEGVSAAFSEAGITHAVTGAAAADKLAPMLTSQPQTDVWIAADVPLQRAIELAGAKPVRDGANLRLMQAADDAPLAFRRHHETLTLANPVRVYLDLLKDPRRGREQAEHLRQVVGF
jgi:hypothetical protein